MLSRKILRIKAFKVIYALAENPAMSLKDAEVELEAGCEAARDLYLFLLNIIGPLTAEAGARIRAAREKFNPTPQEANPNLKFVNNRIAPLFESDEDFRKLVKRRRLDWDEYDVLLRHLYETIRERDYFKSYMESGESSLKEDAALFSRIFAEEFFGNPEVEDILEDISIYWNDDLAYVLNFCCRAVEDLGRGQRWRFPELYMSRMPGHEGMESDKAFVFNLLRAAYNGFGDFRDTVAEHALKWDGSRICATDMALIVCGMAEARAFPLTPVKIIINEYVELSKFYSTPESKSFVNGLLDKLINK